MTVSVLDNPVVIFLFKLFHPGTTDGACAAPVAPVAPPVVAQYQPEKVYLCNASNGLFVDIVTNEVDSFAKGNRPAFEVLNSKAPGTPNTNPNNTTGYFTCVLPAGAKLLPGVAADTSGWLYPLPAYSYANHNSTIIYPAYVVG